MMAVEIERKWVTDLAALAASADDARGSLRPPDVWPAGEELRQGYLAVDGDVTTRLRITADRAVLTVKAGSGLARTEVEAEIDLDAAEQLWAYTAGRRIAKRRHRLPLAGTSLVAEVDVYHGDLDGLVTVEVEFAVPADAERFVAPPWFGTDVTGDARWLNAALALRGRPDTPPRA